ncbi:MAG: hypothetical protein EP346_10675 [Bacteroidetes bacterium]|nr:MAG: hypothetical protein EP346_10675 [Bacteroidota bacterium]
MNNLAILLILSLYPNVQAFCQNTAAIELSKNRLTDTIFFTVPPTVRDTLLPFIREYGDEVNFYANLTYPDLTIPDSACVRVALYSYYSLGKKDQEILQLTRRYLKVGDYKIPIKFHIDEFCDLEGGAMSLSSTFYGVVVRYLPYYHMKYKVLRVQDCMNGCGF